jgi:acyl carrier protein
VRHIEAELRRFVVDNFLFRRQAHFSDNDSFLSMGIIDSTGMLELVSYLEKHYGIHVEDTDLIPQNLDSVTQMAQFVRRKLHQEEEIAAVASGATAYSA